MSVGLGLARFYTNSPGADKFRPASLSVANNLLSPVLRPRAMFLKRFVIYDFAPERGVKCCDEHVCVSVHSRIWQTSWHGKPRGWSSLNFLCMLIMTITIVTLLCL